jgi:putative dimethyl sulfoxide reductase chaperone
LRKENRYVNAIGRAQKADACANVFRLLSACFYQPDREMFLEEGVCDQLLVALHTAFPQAVALASEMSASMEASSQDELLVEYSRLFLGPVETPAYLYGSIYLDAGKTVMGDSTMKVKRLYGENQLALDGSLYELPDHIAIELEFLYLLNFQEAQALAADDNLALGRAVAARRKFLDEHLGRWISPFAAKVREHAPEGFYNQLARLTEECVQSHREAILA